MTGAAATAPEFLAACWTSAGDCMPLRGPDTSPLDVRNRIAAVAGAGYKGFGLAHPDLMVAKETIGWSTLGAVLRDHGIEEVQLERIDGWWAIGDRRSRADALRNDLFDACSVLGVASIKVGADDDGSPVSWDQLCVAFDELASAGREAGVRIGFENTPFSPSPIRSTDNAIKLVTDVGNDNGGIVLDIWHAFRGGTDYAVIPDLLPPQYLFGVELDDGRTEVVGTQIEDTFDHRMPCGTGDFDVPAFIAVVQELGWNGLWGIEHMSATDRTRPLLEVLTEVKRAALSCFPLADEDHRS